MPPTRPALLGGTQKRKTSPQFMFPSSEMNFDQGRFVGASNNAAQQSLFSNNDPFAKAVAGVGTSTSEAPAGVSSVLDVAIAQGGAQAPLVDPVQAAPIPASTDPRDDPSTVHGSFGPSGASAELVKPVTALDIMENPIGAAAQKLGAVFINNPFISAKGRQALREGRVPQMNDLQPAFFRFTSPENVQALQKLISQADSAGGTSPTQSTQDFFSNIFTAPTL